MSLWNRNAPAEQSHADRAIGLPAEGPQHCTACGDTSRVHLHDIGGGFGRQYVCVEPKPCRERAQAQGIYGRVPERRAA